MKVTLRKAHAIQGQIKAAIGRVSLSTQVSVTIYDESPTETVKKAREQLLANIAIVDRLTKIRDDVRKAIMVANSTHGISDLIAEDAALATHQQRATKQAGSAVAISETQLLSQIASQKARNDKGDLYHREENVAVNLLTQEDVDGFAKLALAATRRRTSIADELLAANTQNTITISDDDHAYLQDHGVI